MTPEIVDRLTYLHAHAIDARHDYAEAFGHADDQDLMGVFRDMMALHSQNAAELAADLYDLGVDLDDPIAGAPPRTSTDSQLQSSVLDERVLPVLIDAERMNAAAYEDALALPAIPAEISAHILQQKARLVSAISGLNLLKN
jgi:hypothetical protein